MKVSFLNSIDRKELQHVLNDWDDKHSLPIVTGLLYAAVQKELHNRDISFIYENDSFILTCKEPVLHMALTNESINNSSYKQWLKDELNSWLENLIDDKHGLKYNLKDLNDDNASCIAIGLLLVAWYKLIHKIPVEPTFDSDDDEMCLDYSWGNHIFKAPQRDEGESDMSYISRYYGKHYHEVQETIKEYESREVQDDPTRLEVRLCFGKDKVKINEINEVEMSYKEWILCQLK